MKVNVQLKKYTRAISKFAYKNWRKCMGIEPTWEGTSPPYRIFGPERQHEIY